MTKKRKISDKRGKSAGSRKAGARNLALWKKNNPKAAKTCTIKHGAHSKQIRKRYSDARTREGKQLKAVIDGLVNAYGPDLSIAECLIIDRMREKIIILMQIGKYVDSVESVVNAKGELLPCLYSNAYLAYSESLRRDLDSLEKISKKRPANIPNLSDWMQEQNKQGNGPES